jgi:hypothetical protein
VAAGPNLDPRRRERRDVADGVGVASLGDHHPGALGGERLGSSPAGTPAPITTARRPSNALIPGLPRAMKSA